MNASSAMNSVSIWTPLNPKPQRTTPDNRRVFRDGRWQRPEPKLNAVIQWLKGGDK